MKIFFTALCILTTIVGCSHSTPVIINNTNRESIPVTLTGQLYIINREQPVMITELTMSAKLIDQTTIEFTNHTNQQNYQVKFSQLHQIQSVLGHQLQLKGTAMNSVQIVIK